VQHRTLESKTLAEMSGAALLGAAAGTPSNGLMTCMVLGTMPGTILGTILGGASFEAILRAGLSSARGVPQGARRSLEAPR